MIARNKLFLLVFIFLSLKLPVYASELQEYGFENFERLDFYLSKLSEPRTEVINDFVMVDSPDGYNDDKFKTFLDKVLDDSLVVLSDKLLEPSRWTDSKVPEFIVKQKNFFNSENNLNVLSDIQNFFYFNFPSYFATKDIISEDCNVVVIGDMHGNYKDFVQIIKHLIAKKILTEDLKLMPGNRIVFLGDFVDRGSKGLELSLFIFLLKILNSKSVIILKGNHEDYYMTYGYGFLDELSNKFNNNLCVKLYNRFLSLFYLLPEAYCLRIYGKNFLFSHAGWSEFFDYSDFINNVDSMFVETFTLNKQLIISPFSWYDISPFIDSRKVIEGRGICYPVSHIRNFMEDSHVDAIFKGHDHRMPKKLKYGTVNLTDEQREIYASGFCALLEDKIFLTISTSIDYGVYGVERYFPTYALLTVDQDDYLVEGIVCALE